MSGQDVIGKATMASVEYLKKLSSFENGKVLLEKINEEPMRGYSEQKTVVGSNMEKLVKIVATYLDEMAMCTSTAISKRCLREMSRL